MATQLTALFLPYFRSHLYEKLYQESFELRDRLEEKRRQQEQQFEDMVNTTKPPMSWVSQEMMAGRTAGGFENYGEMLYAESLEAMARKREKVSSGLQGRAHAPAHQTPCWTGLRGHLLDFAGLLLPVHLQPLELFMNVIFSSHF